METEPGIMEKGKELLKVLGMLVLILFILTILI